MWVVEKERRRVDAEKLGGLTELYSRAIFVRVKLMFEMMIMKVWIDWVCSEILKDKNKIAN